MWSALAPQNIAEPLHVVPVDDLIEHDTFTTDCICGPRIEIVEVGAPLVIVHNSLDGRELDEPDYEPRT